ncbi:nuclease [Phnomibacter ginsenosidimutans]|uniref:Nuclease n=1 Tax=Phnomibacter ginsenosidimutans TaxID=2676868 RepID=A0A6I6G966_9BACT|nr:nuclease [Phnomibacter ginsenosidimutans]
MNRALLVLLFTLTAWLAVSAQLRGTVIAIADGDTFTLLTAQNQQVKIRLHGIDCPEKKQPYSNNAKAYISSLVFGKQVFVQVKNKDRYGRTIGVVLLEDKRNVNELLLQAGWAWHFKKYDQDARWAAMEQQARRNRKGLWADPNPIAPWDWRARKK